MESPALLKIPRIIHQTWKTRDLPDKWRLLQQTWKKNHATWEYRFTTDADNRNFFEQFYPGFLPVYDAYPLDINRAEVYRYFALYHYGGVYVDLDFESIRPLDELLAGHELILAFEPDSHASAIPVRARGFSHIVCNAFLASSPRHSFWEHLQQLLLKHQRDANPLDATSIFLLTRAHASYTQPALITWAPTDTLYPIDYNQSKQVSTDLKQLALTAAPHAYAIHYWHGSWWRAAILNSVHQRVKKNLTCYLKSRGS